MTFLNFYFIFVGHFCPPGSGSETLLMFLAVSVLNILDLCPLFPAVSEQPDVLT